MPLRVCFFKHSLLLSRIIPITPDPVLGIDTWNVPDKRPILKELSSRFNTGHMLHDSEQDNYLEAAEGWLKGRPLNMRKKRLCKIWSLLVSRYVTCLMGAKGRCAMQGAYIKKKQFYKMNEMNARKTLSSISTIALSWFIILIAAVTADTEFLILLPYNKFVFWEMIL